MSGPANSTPRTGPDASAADAAVGWWRLFRQRLALGSEIELPVLSGSMGSHLPVGSILTITGVAAGGCRAGDIVVFRERDQLVAHRLLVGLPPAGRGLFLQAGDGLSRPGWIRAEVIAGLVTAVRGADGITRDLRTPEARRDARRRARVRLARALVDPLVLAWRKVRS